jgi:NAD(P)H-hydrate epimerase
MRLVTPDEMREMDRQTIEEIGLPGIVLMERAALGAVDALLDHVDEESLERVGILCGGGNNGGDGIAMARILEQRGYETRLAFLSSTDSIDGDAAQNLAVARELGLDFRDFGDLEPEAVDQKLSQLQDCDIWVDALLGTGLTGDVRGRYVPAIEFLNDRESVFAVDIPSGVSGKTGEQMGVAVDADLTATFGGAKLGQSLYPGRELCGDLHVIDIGIPDAVRAQVGATAEWLDDEWAAHRLDDRPPVYHKGAAGRILAVAGSHEKTGAALLVARGALHGGGGLITVGTTEEVVDRIAPTVNEVMAAEMVDREVDQEADRRLAEFIETVDTVAVGPGLETHDGAIAAVETILESDADRAVLDADALNIVAGELGDETIAHFADEATAVLTPHPGEMARLCDCTTDEVLDHPVECARDYAAEVGAIVVLKMATTIVAAPDGRLAINRSGNPGMATGGMGDVLTGIVAARLAETTGDAFEDVCLAVYAHGCAGDAAAESRGERGLSATDLSEHLPKIWQRLERAAN